MEVSILTIVLGMIISFTLPLLIITCVLVCLLWPKQQSSDADVESHAIATNAVHLKHIEDTNLLRIIKSLQTFIGLRKIEDSQRRLLKVSSVAQRLIRFGHIQDTGSLERLTSHLTGVVIVRNPEVECDTSKQKVNNKMMTPK